MHNAPTRHDVATLKAQAGTGVEADNGTYPGAKSKPGTARLPDKAAEADPPPDADRIWDISDWFRSS